MSVNVTIVTSSLTLTVTVFSAQVSLHTAIVVALISLIGIVVGAKVSSHVTVEHKCDFGCNWSRDAGNLHVTVVGASVSLNATVFGA